MKPLLENGLKSWYTQLALSRKFSAFFVVPVAFLLRRSGHGARSEESVEADERPCRKQRGIVFSPGPSFRA